MNTRYETDVVAWAGEQASLIRASRFGKLDLAHIAEGIEDVGKSEQRGLASRMAVLLAHILKWKFQPEKRFIPSQGGDAPFGLLDQHGQVLKQRLPWPPLQ